MIYGIWHAWGVSHVAYWYGVTYGIPFRSATAAAMKPSSSSSTSARKSAVRSSREGMVGTNMGIDVDEDEDEGVGLGLGVDIALAVELSFVGFAGFIELVMAVGLVGVGLMVALSLGIGIPANRLPNCLSISATSASSPFNSAASRAVSSSLYKYIDI
jgi:hypothetical protein